MCLPVSKGWPVGPLTVWDRAVTLPLPPGQAAVDGGSSGAPVFLLGRPFVVPRFIGAPARGNLGENRMNAVTTSDAGRGSPNS
jgi:hypothetical protein